MHDLKNGKGKQKWFNGDKYSGSWKNNKRHGEGEYIWKDGEKYIGNWADNK